jgi:DNA-binding NtrC family response regulator
MVKVLIIDDDIGIRETMKDILDEEGFETDLASNGEIGIDAVERDGFDLILLDMKMPGLSGMDVFTRIKALKPDLKIYIITAHAIDDTFYATNHDEIAGIFYKPIPINTLLNQIKATCT